MDSQSNRHIVQIFNKDETTIYAHHPGDPEISPEANRQTVITFPEKEPGRPAGSATGMVLSRQNLGEDSSIRRLKPSNR